MSDEKIVQTQPAIEQTADAIASAPAPYMTIDKGEGFAVSLPTDEAKLVSVLRKVNALGKDIMACDWEKDKEYKSTTPGRNYFYLSSDKTKMNIAPLIFKNGLVFVPNTTDLTPRPPVGSMTTHWTITYTGTLYDIDTGAHISGSVYGEAADSGDKAMGKAITSGNKLFWFNMFQIADGIDPEASPSERASVESRKNLNANTVEPPAKTPAVAPATASAPAVPKAVPPTVPKAVPPTTASAPAVPKTDAPAVPKAEPPKTASAPAVPVVKGGEAPATRQIIPMALGNAIAKIVESRPELEEEAHAIKTIAEAQDFVAKY